MMLALPESGMSFSKKKHNVDFDIFCDWVEASLLFQEESVSMSDIVDALLEHEIYEDQDFAEEFVASAWGVLTWRFRQLGSPLGITVTGTRLSKTESWREHPAYAFCLLLTCISYLYPERAGGLRDNNIQGDLFEKLSHESLSEMLPGWKVRRVGWSPDNPVKLKAIIGDLVSSLNEVVGSEVDLYVTSHSNEIGLDLLAYFSFDDSHASVPVVMMQCASGKDWKGKRKTPDLSIWRKIINFNSRPVKGFAMPYAFADQSTFRREATTVEGIFLDRYRLLAPRERSSSWVSAGLKNDLVAFLEPRVAALPVIASVV